MTQYTCTFTTSIDDVQEIFSVHDESIAESIWCGLLDNATVDYVMCENGFSDTIAKWYNPSHKYKVITYNKHGDRDGKAYFQSLDYAVDFWFDVASVTDIYHYPTIWKMNGNNWERVQGW